MNPAAGLAKLWEWLLLDPVEWLLDHLHSGFAAFGPTKAIGAFGLGVIVVTLVLRLLLMPLFTWQLRTTRRTQQEQRQIAPQLQELRRKYKKEPQKLNAEMMKLYREHGISPFSGLMGCLPLLVQYPILIALYQGIRGVSGNLGHSDLGFLWVGSVNQTAADVCCVASNNHGTIEHGNWLVGLATHPAVLILPVVSAMATFMQSKMMMPPMRPDMSDQERQAASISRQMSVMMPAIVLIMGLFFPQGIALYWVTQSLFMIVQQWLIVGYGGLHVPHWFPGAGRVTKLSYPQYAPAAALAGGGRAERSGKAARPASSGRGGAPAAIRGGTQSRTPAAAGSRSGSARRKRGR